MKKKNLIKNLLITAALFLSALGISFLFQQWGVEEHITTLFVFAVFLISLTTDGYFYGVGAAFASMLAINYAFTYPYLQLDFIIPSNLISAVIMIIIAVLTGTLTIKIKRHEAVKAEGEKERMRANLLRAVSHDLRTPLTTIYGASATLLENRANLSVEQQDAVLRSIREDSDWLMHMVENLLSITRIDSGQIKIIKTPTVLDELIDSVMAKFAKRYPGQQVLLDTPQEIMVIPMDALLIEQVLVNLLENAVLHAEGMTQLWLCVSSEGDKAVFKVRDDGCGIREERLKHIFSGYGEVQEEGADSRRRNMGIGLSVCATIIRAHGGEITASNQPEGGSVFSFSLDQEENDHDE